jgi:hypothetical protein
MSCIDYEILPCTEPECTAFVKRVVVDAEIIGGRVESVSYDYPEGGWSDGAETLCAEHAAARRRMNDENRCKLCGEPARGPVSLNDNHLACEQREAAEASR